MLLLFPGESWFIIRKIMYSNINFGKDLILRIGSDRTNRQNFNNYLSENDIAELFIWIDEQFIFEGDPKTDRFHFVSPNDEVKNYKNELIAELKNRGTSNGQLALKLLQEKYPEEDWFKIVYYESVIIKTIKSWIPLSPKEFLSIVRNNKTYSIQNEFDLLNATIDSLKLLEEELHGQTPFVKFLWENKETKPKDENSLSDFVKMHLQKNLNNVIANREVEIRPTMGKEEGENTDILIQTINQNPSNKSSIFGIIIETKGCWNKELWTAMESQLLKRYLNNNQIKYGVYLIGWYRCDSWDKNDYRYAATPQMELNEVKEKLKLQEDILSKDGYFIKSYVLDCRIR
jgi:hypothetical protein